MNPLADQLASALAAMLDNHYCGHGCCDIARDTLASYERETGLTVTPARLRHKGLLRRH